MPSAPSPEPSRRRRIARVRGAFEGGIGRPDCWWKGKGVVFWGWKPPVYGFFGQIFQWWKMMKTTSLRFCLVRFFNKECPLLGVFINTCFPAFFGKNNFPNNFGFRPSTTNDVCFPCRVCSRVTFKGIDVVCCSVCLVFFVHWLQVLSSFTDCLNVYLSLM